MVQINISSGQGITQAIASQLGLSKDDCKKVGLARWQQVMTLVDQNNTQNKANNEKSIFSGGNNVQNINKKEAWKTDFVVHPNDTIEIKQTFWDKIVALLKPTAAPATETTAKVEAEPSVESPKEEKPIDVKPAEVESTEVVTDGEELLGFADEVSNLNISKVKDHKNDFEVIDKQEWNDLIKSGDGVKIDTAYKNAFKNLGQSFNIALDKKGGNGDGELTFEEFKASGLYDAANDDAALKKAFNNFDLDSNGKIDAKEMAAFLRLADNSVNPNEKGGDNARLDAYSLMARLMAMGNDDMKSNVTDAYNHLFDQE